MKKTVSIFMILTMCFLMVSPAFADHRDERVTLNWTKNDCYDNTRWRMKEDNSGVYFKVVNHSLPGSGFYIRAVSGENSCGVASNWFYINDYRPYVINHNMPGGAGYKVRLETWYPKEWGYNWGNVTIDWSPDFAPQSGVIELY